MASFDILQNIRVKKNTVYCARKANSISLKSKGLFLHLSKAAVIESDVCIECVDQQGGAVVLCDFLP